MIGQYSGQLALWSVNAVINQYSDQLAQWSIFGTVID